jgi:ZIP family zinc transporter
VFLSPAASSLLVGGFIGCWINISNRALGLVMAFGAGVLISAVAYEHGGKLAGLFTVLGFAVSVAIVVMERS